MRRHLSIGSIDGGLVEAGFGDAGLQIVGNHHRRNAAEKSESPCVRAYPVRQRLRALVAINRKPRSPCPGARNQADKLSAGGNRFWRDPDGNDRGSLPPLADGDGTRIFYCRGCHRPRDRLSTAARR
ncbi:hypothetical protein J2S34_002327 [Nitrobacter winogradskyi]|uniref:Uncharacterized protein n=1 Tax=Nitrobacter winogradskyi TaxID=913 RepID=A0ACC6AJN0_NITWI|nr:hypothetical protein [Nitrobacter winogradskyi]